MRRGKSGEPEGPRVEERDEWPGIVGSVTDAFFENVSGFLLLFVYLKIEKKNSNLKLMAGNLNCEDVGGLPNFLAVKFCA